VSLLPNQTVFVIDDDPVFRHLIVLVLKKFGLKGEAFSDADTFFAAADKKVPAMFIIDLNMGTTNSGLEIVKTLRERFPRELPIFIVSATTDATAVAHAIEIGADDYIFKPLDREVLASKLMNHLKSNELAEAKLDFKPGVSGEFKALVQTEFQVCEIDELGVKVLSKHLISKGTAVKVSGTWVTEITGRDRPALVTVSSTWIEPDKACYGAYMEFDPNDEELGTKVRSWITRKNLDK